jgi:urocanate reductase
MKRVLKAAAAGLLAFSLAACGGASQETPAASSAPASADAAAVSGTFSGEGSGKNGTIAVNVTVEAGKITGIEVTEEHESKVIADAMDILTQEMIEGNSVNVDNVTGATFTSFGFKTAVEDALANGGIDAQDLVANTVETPAAEDQTLDCDVAIIGAGGAGLVAGITAAEAGAKVIIVEKLKISAGNTLISGAEYAAPNNWIQERDGIEDSPELMKEDMLTGGDNEGDPVLVGTICDNALAGAEWLRDDVNVVWEDTEMQFGGHSVPRSLVPQGATGEELVSKLLAKAEEVGVQIIYNATAKNIIMTDGTATGVYAEASDGSGSTYTVNASKGVILATGGFGSNVEMREQYNPDMGSQYKSTDSVADTGDGILMAEEVGANLLDMQYIQTYPMCDPLSGSLLYTDDARLYGYSIIVNKEGVRFVNELDRRDVMSEAILAQTGGVCYELMDANGFKEASIAENHGGEVQFLKDHDELVEADTLEEAAAFFDIDAEALAQTVETYNSYVDAGEDPDFQRSAMNMKIEEGPFYIVMATPAVHHTMGGVQINENAQVINTDGEVIPHLYAAGEVTGNIHGTNRLGSCAIADLTVFGRIAGTNAAAGE